LDKDEYKNIESKYPLLWDILMKVVKPAFLKRLQNDMSNAF